MKTSATYTLERVYEFNDSPNRFKIFSDFNEKKILLLNKSFIFRIKTYNDNNYIKRVKDRNS